MRGERRPHGADPAIAELPQGPAFFDTNVIVYAHDTTDAVRGERARQLLFEAMRQRKLVISTQVMQEFYGVVVRKNWMPPDDALTALQLLAEHTVVPASADSVLRAIGLQQRYVISVWDALIVQAALDAGCPVLFSEDLQHGQVFQARGGAAAEVTVVNPFAAPPVEALGRALHEPSRVYANKLKASRAGRATR